MYFIISLTCLKVFTSNLIFETLLTSVYRCPTFPTIIIHNLHASVFLHRMFSPNIVHSMHTSYEDIGYKDCMHLAWHVRIWQHTFANGMQLHQRLTRTYVEFSYLGSDVGQISVPPTKDCMPRHGMYISGNQRCPIT